MKRWERGRRAHTQHKSRFFLVAVLKSRNERGGKREKRAVTVRKRLVGGLLGSRQLRRRRRGRERESMADGVINGWTGVLPLQNLSGS